MHSTYQCIDCQHIYRLYDKNIIDFHKQEYRKNEQRVSNEFDENGNV